MVPLIEREQPMINPQPAPQSTQQDVQTLEATIEALGPLTSANFDQAAQLLQQRKTMINSIAMAQASQFYPDATSAISTLQQSALAGTDRFIGISNFLRTFAEYIAQNAMSLTAGDPKIKSTVDGIKAMTGGN